MNLEEFNASVAEEQAPRAGLSIPLAALWWDAKGNWAHAHSLVDELESRDGTGFTRLAELICQECDLIYLGARNGCRELFADDGGDAGTEQFYRAQHFLMWQR
jgi:hypothetical protein